MYVLCCVSDHPIPFHSPPHPIPFPTPSPLVSTIRGVEPVRSIYITCRVISCVVVEKDIRVEITVFSAASEGKADCVSNINSDWFEVTFQNYKSVEKLEIEKKLIVGLCTSSGSVYCPQLPLSCPPLLLLHLLLPVLLISLSLSLSHLHFLKISTTRKVHVTPFETLKQDHKGVITHGSQIIKSFKNYQ